MNVEKEHDEKVKVAKVSKEKAEKLLPVLIQNKLMIDKEDLDKKSEIDKSIESAKSKIAKATQDLSDIENVSKTEKERVAQE